MASHPRKCLAYIVHLCVVQSHRRLGVAKALFEKLKTDTQNTFHGIRVRCRRDYEEANAVWPKLCFVAIGEKPGRSKLGSTLTVWWFNHGHPTLFSFTGDKAESKLRAIIDANLFFQLQEQRTPENEETNALLADWLQENVELCVTKEIFNEIDRHPDESERRQWRAYANRFTIIDSSDDKYQNANKDLRMYFPEHMTKSDASDLRHLSWAVAAGLLFFATRDNGLLKKADQIYSRFGLRIIRPSDLVINQDQLLREAEYQPVRLEGSRVKIELVSSGQSSFLVDTFLSAQVETKSVFRDLLCGFLAGPRSYEVKIVRIVEEPLALIVYGRGNNRELEVPILRIVRNSLSPTLARHLILSSVFISSGEKRPLTRVTDAYLSDCVVDALREMGFVFIENFWIKANFDVPETKEAIVESLSSLNTSFPEAKPYFQSTIDSLNSAYSDGNIQAMLQVERSLWPAKLADIDVPAFIVPIRPEWAMHLFDPHIARQDLLGSDPSLIFRLENVYYRACRPRVLTSPARILWYVSRGGGKYQGTMAIRASSYLDEVVVGEPKELYSQFRRLGVFKYKDVSDIVGGKPGLKVMAFRFSNTEVFVNPISRAELKGIWESEFQRDFHIQTPISISKELFFRLYKSGKGIK